MRKAIIFGVMGVFLASSAAMAVRDAGIDSRTVYKSQTVVQGQGQGQSKPQTQTPAQPPAETSN